MRNQKKEANGQGFAASAEPRAEITPRLVAELVRRKVQASIPVSNARARAIAKKLGLVPVLDPRYPRVGFTYRDADGAPVMVEVQGETRMLVVERYLEDEAHGILAPPEPKKPGERKRFRFPKGIRPYVYYPHDLLNETWRSVLNGPPRTVYVVEGQLKAAALCWLGLPTVGIGGVDNVSSKKLGIPLLPELVEICQRGHTIAIVFDYDPKPRTQRNVRRARMRFRDKLKAHGCRDVRVVEIPGVVP